VTFRAVASAAVSRLEAAGLGHGEAAQSAVVLARFVLGWSGADWVARSRDAAGEAFLAGFDRLIERRAGHEPVAYITGEREFYGRPFLVTRDVLIPRPETELIVDLALNLMAAPSRIVDVGTGSGCLAISLALEFPSARVVATDVSSPALAVARANATRLGASDRIDFRHGAFFAREERDQPCDLVVANPPYIDAADRPSLPRDVSEQEPAVALFAEDRGLSVIRGVIEGAPAALAPGGALLMEIGAGQAAEVRRMVEHTREWSFIEIRPDLQGIPRVLVARAAPPRA
jgi:release factor glutamine methyltransferase